MLTIRRIAGLRRQVRRWRREGQKVALVPTMGALHEGHLSLVRLARRRAGRVVATIFVNPTQFAPNEDLASYPRQEKRDLELLRSLDVDLAFIPPVEEMYAQGFATAVQVGGPAAAGLEDSFRPHFFGGVATVVAKLLLQSLPDSAIFGEKDYQQLLVIRRMARDLDIPTAIVGARTVREKDGLALSSRNAYLSAEERTVAPRLHAVLQDCARDMAAGTPAAKAVAAARRKLTRAGFKVDYVAARNAETLQPLGSLGAGEAEPVRILAAVRLGRTRLIDNIPA